MGNAKQKAEELVESFLDFSKSHDYKGDLDDYKIIISTKEQVENAKKCALVCIRYILDHDLIMVKDFLFLKKTETTYPVHKLKSARQFWLKVEQEIRLLD